MHAAKVLVFVAIAGVIIAAGVFTFVPDTRPPMVKKWFRQMGGFTPAKTPTEALDKFRDAIKKRDYETASEYTDKDYREQMLKVAKSAKKLGEAIDSLVYNMDKHGVNSKKTQHILRLLEPFPKTFKVVDIKESEGGKKATAKIADDAEQLSAETAPELSFIQKNRNMILSLVPVEFGITYDVLELQKDETGHWKIFFPVTPRLRVSVEALKDNATNYANALYQIRDEVKTSAPTKAGIEKAVLDRIGESQ